MYLATALIGPRVARSTRQTKHWHSPLSSTCVCVHVCATKCNIYFGKSPRFLLACFLASFELTNILEYSNFEWPVTQTSHEECMIRAIHSWKLEEKKTSRSQRDGESRPLVCDSRHISWYEVKEHIKVRQLILTVNLFSWCSVGVRELVDRPFHWFNVISIHSLQHLMTHESQVNLQLKYLWMSSLFEYKVTHFLTHSVVVFFSFLLIQ